MQLKLMLVGTISPDVVGQLEIEVDAEISRLNLNRLEDQSYLADKVIMAIKDYNFVRERMERRF